MDDAVLRNRYRVLRRLGAGGVGSVYLVEELHGAGAERPRLALKALFIDGSHEALLASLRLEFRVLATLRHPLIARVYDFGSLPENSGLEGSDGRPGYFFTRDLIDGQDLEAYCQPLSVAETCLVCQRTAEVLDVLHRAGMVHGDFKPANVIVSSDGRPHLIDFGLARTEGQSTVASGTAAFLSPEVLRGKPVDRRADLYALGIAVFQLLTGQLPLPKASLGELIAWHLDGAPLKVSPVVKVPEEIDEVVQRLTSRDPDRRYPSAAEVALALGEAAVKAGAEPAPLRVSLFVPPAPGENLAAPLVELEAAVHERALRRSRGPHMIAVEGDPGAGKSTLLQELAWRCQLAGVEVIRGEFRQGDPRAFGLWIDVLSQVAGVVGAPHPLEGPRTTQVDRYTIYQQISDYLSTSATVVPLLLLLDSVEQADEESKAALRFVAHTLKPDDPLMLVVAFRRDEQLYRDLGAPPRKLLDPLALSDVRRMAADAAGRTVDELAQRIHGHTGGNPQFVMEVLRRLGEAGWPASPDLNELAPPRGLEQMYARRLEELDSVERAVLHVLAVLGRPSSGQLLGEVFKIAHPDEADGRVGLPLERLETLEWLDRTPDGAYAFRQGPASLVLYSRCAPEQRERIHLAATEVLDRHGPREPVEWTRHAIGARRLDLALQTLDEAIRILRGLGAHRSAIQLYVDVTPLLADDPARLRRIHRELGELFHTVGDVDSAARELELACHQAEGSELDAARIVLAKVHRTAGRAETSLEFLAQVRSSRPTRDLLVAAQAEAAAAYIALDAHDHVLETVDEALGLLEQEGDGHAQLVARAELRGQKAVALGYLQRRDEAAREFEAALADARSGGDRRVEGAILNRWAISASRQGDFAKMLERYTAALECARELGDVEQVAAIRLNLAVDHMQRGEYAACLEHLPESLRLFEAMGALKNLAVARCNMGYLQLRLGLYEQARASLKKALQETHQVGRRSGEALAMLLLALVQARRLRFDEARRGIADARQLYLELGQGLDAADALLDLADVELFAGDLQAAGAALRQLREEVDLDQVPGMKVRAAALEARAAALGAGGPRAPAGARGAELAALEAALALARELDTPELVWDCHAAAMELADATGHPGQATRHAAEAVRTLEQMAAGLPADVQAAFWQDPRRRAVKQRAVLHPSEGAPRPRTIDTATDPASADLASDVTMPVITPPPDHSPTPVSIITNVEERFYRLLEIYRQINSELDPERLLGLVMDNAVELTGAERGFLLLGDTAATLKVEVARNLDPQGETGAYSRSIAEKVFTAGQPVITVSARNDPRFKEYMSVHQLQLESVLCIPIHARGSTVGVLYMESRFQSGRFTPADQRLLMAFGDQVAIALNNARLLADNIRKAKELERAKREIEALAEERGELLNQRTQQLEEARRDLAETRRQLETKIGMYGMVGRSPAMLRLFELVERVAATDVPVLIEGESGTGKEMVARAIHQTSDRRKGRLVSVNCAAIPETLLESELFGHVRGAFTGADRERKGLFTSAHGGTLFLDEIGDMPARMQVDLLRALQEKTIRPIGAQQDIKVDVRVIAASNKPLTDLIRQKRFREDLYYRLNVVTLKLPALRERADDIPLLCDHFISAISAQTKAAKKRLTRGALHTLMEYTWPGNVRQLEHALMNAAVLADGDVLHSEDFTLEAPTQAPLPVEAPAPSRSPAASLEDRKARERQQIMEALEAVAWNKTQAAERLGMPRRTFYRRLREYDIQ